MCAKRAENFRLRGGTNVTVGGDSKFWGWGGTGPHGGGQALDGVGSPPIPPHTGQPCIPQNKCFMHELLLWFFTPYKDIQCWANIVQNNNGIFCKTIMCPKPCPKSKVLKVWWNEIVTLFLTLLATGFLNTVCHEPHPLNQFEECEASSVLNSWRWVYKFS